MHALKIRLGPKPRAAMRIVVSVFVITGACLPTGAAAVTWPEVVTLARGQTVDWFMADARPPAIDYVEDYLTPRLKELYGISLRQVPAAGISETMGMLVSEKEAGFSEDGGIDLLWINSENFRAAKAKGVLYGPFVDGLPNNKLVDWHKPSVSSPFIEPAGKMALPWGSDQMVMVYDEKRTPQPPPTMADLLDWIREHPGRFAYPAPPDDTGSAFVQQVFYHVSGGTASWQAPLEESRFEQAAADCYQLLRDIAPFLWREGRTYPESSRRLNALFANGEVDFSANSQPAEASIDIAAGRYPDTVRTFVFEGGTIGDTRFVAIPFNAAHKAGAMVVANFIFSPEAQLKKADPKLWGDFPAIDTSRLDYTWREKFLALPKGNATLPDAVLQKHRLPEPPPEISSRLVKGWQEHVQKRR